MNITTFNSNVGNLRIAPFNNGASDSTSDGSNFNNNNSTPDRNNNNNNNFNHFKSPLNTHSLNTQTNGPSPFASSFSSPSLEDDSTMLSLATLNLKGYKDTTKFSSVLSDIQHKNLTLVGLTETHMPAATASILFREFWATQTSRSPYTAFWDYNSKDKSSGVGLLVHHSLGTFVQKIVQYAGRYIAIDFFLPERKIRVINIYNFQKNQWDRSSHGIPSGSAF